MPVSPRLFLILSAPPAYHSLCLYYAILSAPIRYASSPPPTPCKFLCINLVRYPRDTHRLFEDAASKITM